MSENLPVVTVVIAARPDQRDIPALAASGQLDYPVDRLEIIVARGTQPSVQRNQAIRAARGEIIYFLDDDSIPNEANLRHGTYHFEDDAVKIVGGPNLCPPGAPPLEQAFAQVMGSWLAFGPSRARYSSVGSARDTDEKELILCNLLARRSTMIEAGGFDEALYPNEENALMDDIRAAGGRLVYDPELIVYRRPRNTLRAFVKMLFRYGRGRAEQFRLHPTPGSVMNFVPPLFCVYLAAIPFLPLWCLWPLPIYGIALLGQAVVIGRKTHRFPDRIIPLLVLTHVAYGVGFWRGLFSPLKTSDERPPGPVTLEKVGLK